MTTAPPLTGQDINVAARFTRLALVAELDHIDTTFEDWVVINLVGTDPTTTVADVVERLSTGLGLGPSEVVAFVGDLVDRELLTRDGDALALGPLGEPRWLAGQARVAELVGSLYAGFDADELATARRVLVTVTERAQAHLAS